jgi:hypothetical protein
LRTAKQPPDALNSSLSQLSRSVHRFWSLLPGCMTSATPPGLRGTGFHPIDGARHLQTIGWPPAICNLVAHHSGARFVAKVLRLDRQLEAFPFSEDAVSDALTVADQTTGPHGEAMTVEERMRDMLRRHGPDSPNALAHPLRGPYLRAAAARVAERLEHTGIDRARHRILTTGVAA